MSNNGTLQRHRDGIANPDALAEYLRKIAIHDIAALASLYDCTSCRLLAICLRITQSRVSAEDVMQEVYIKVWNRAAGYDRERAEPMVWLAALARNSAIDWYRAQARRRTTALSEAGTLIDRSPPIDEELIERQQSELVVDMVDELRAEHRDIIRAIYFEGLTYAELAQREGVPVGTLKSRIHRILAGLGKAWQHD